MAQQFDTVVVGGGPGGYVAAIRAAQLGLSVALVEREALGGICLNWGCIPTKSLLHTADLLREMRRAGDYGLVTGEISYDTAKVVKRSRAVAEQLSRGVKGLLRKNDVAVIDGDAKLAGAGRLVVTKDGAAAQELRSDAIVLATGARARALPGAPADGERVWTYREAMTPREIPKRLLVIGSGAIGIEFASFYRAMGCDVTVIELLPRILPAEDEEISAFARKAFEKEGIAIHTGAKLESLARAGDGLVAKLATASGALEARFERAIVSVGVTGNVEALGLETTRARAERGFIVTGAHFETAEPGLYAIGDVAGAPCLAHKASHEGVLVMEHIAGNEIHALRRERIPGLHLRAPANRERRAHREQGRRGGAQAAHRALPARRQRQGDRDRRFERAREDDLRRRDRRAIRCAPGRPGRDRADSGLHDRDGPRDHGARADRNDLPAPDDLGSDARGGAREPRTRAARLARGLGTAVRCEAAHGFASGAQIDGRAECDAGPPADAAAPGGRWGEGGGARVEDAQYAARRREKERHPEALRERGIAFREQASPAARSAVGVPERGEAVAGGRAQAHRRARPRRAARPRPSSGTDRAPGRRKFHPRCSRSSRSERAFTRSVADTSACSSVANDSGASCASAGGCAAAAESASAKPAAQLEARRASAREFGCMARGSWWARCVRVSRTRRIRSGAGPNSNENLQKISPSEPRPPCGA